MLNEQIMVSQVFPDLYPPAGGGVQVFADDKDAELKKLLEDLAAARAALEALKSAGMETDATATALKGKIKTLATKINDILGRKGY